MKKLLLSSLLVSSLSVAAVTPAFAQTPTSPATSQTYGQTNNNMLNPGTMNRTFVNDVDRMRGDLNPFNNNGNRVDLNPFDRNNTNGMVTNDRAGTYGTYDRNRMNAYNTNRVTTNGVRTNSYRAAATTTNNRGFSWGWLGLLGLFGLAGMRSRSRDDVR
ncbi:WGxxGxxG family protein [Cohnella panacarvi]|uniref:WGxxGxxG family protein n=1 Tax=Cohnella panacarvi TaxID=400776 RepID=UPI00047D6BA3|nr:WGxxGxxG family protein [Cohnella panacarvi]